MYMCQDTIDGYLEDLNGEAGSAAGNWYRFQVFFSESYFVIVGVLQLPQGYLTAGVLVLQGHVNYAEMRTAGSYMSF